MIIEITIIQIILFYFDSYQINYDATKKGNLHIINSITIKKYLNHN